MTKQKFDKAWRRTQTFTVERLNPRKEGPEEFPCVSRESTSVVPY